jgi:hypothetical protein
MTLRSRSKLVMRRKSRRCPKCGCALNNQRRRCKKCSVAVDLPRNR